MTRLVVHDAMARAVRHRHARDVDALAAIASAGKPFRSWIGFLFPRRASTAPSSS